MNILLVNIFLVTIVQISSTILDIYNSGIFQKSFTQKEILVLFSDDDIRIEQVCKVLNKNSTTVISDESYTISPFHLTEFQENNTVDIIHNIVILLVHTRQLYQVSTSTF